MSEYTGSQFEIIAKAKAALLDSTNIVSSPEEMKVLNDFLFRCWQMGWLDKYGKDDVVEVRHGRWTGKTYKCSLCGKWIDPLQGDADMNYCPNCGAKMDEEEQNNG